MAAKKHGDPGHVSADAAAQRAQGSRNATGRRDPLSGDAVSDLNSGSTCLTCEPNAMLDLGLKVKFDAGTGRSCGHRTTVPK